MFQERNRALLHPTNGNEYFIDRDGRVFRLILQYYRTGKILWPDEENSDLRTSYSISRRELELELDYFQIPFDRGNRDALASQSYVNRAAITTVDAFIGALEEIFYKVVANFGSTVSIV